MRTTQWLGLAALVGGLLLFVRVMFFGVQRRIDEDRLHHRRWPLALAAFLMVFGTAVYARADRVSVSWLAAAALLGLGAGGGAWWWVHRSASVPSLDPEDDPKYRFQGHVARVIEPIAGTADGRIAFEFEGRRLELRARWTPSSPEAIPAEGGRAGTEVVIEIIDGDVAYVEPWAAVEERL